MARHLWSEDCEKRAIIRAAKDQAPALTIKDLQKRFGVSGNIIGAALEKTTAEWQAMAATAPARISYQPRKAIPLGITVGPKESSTSQASNPTTCEASCWEYRTVIARGRLVLNDIVYEHQGSDNSDWKPLAAKTFADALNLFGKDGWELTGMLVLSHGATAFTGLYELAFKRAH
jgi:hypothetical protein